MCVYNCTYLTQPYCTVRELYKLVIKPSVLVRGLYLLWEILLEYEGTCWTLREPSKLWRNHMYFCICKGILCTLRELSILVRKSSRLRGDLLYLWGIFLYCEGTFCTYHWTFCTLREPSGLRGEMSVLMRETFVLCVTSWTARGASLLVWEFMYFEGNLLYL